MEIIIKDDNGKQVYYLPEATSDDLDATWNPYHIAEMKRVLDGTAEAYDAAAA